MEFFQAMDLKVLILYTQKNRKVRKTIDDHLYSFKRYTQGVKYLYFNALYGIPKSFTWMHFDAVIIHYTLLAQRYAPKDYPKFVHSLRHLKDIKATKIIIPQDEYNHTNDICDFINDFNINTVYSCANKKTFNKLYPASQVAAVKYFQVLPGYVDELTARKVKSWLVPNNKRIIDIGYRGRKLPYWTGKYTQKKYEIGEIVKDYCQNHTSLNTDIESGEKHAFLADDWIKFLARCKAVLGCESGATLMDRDGSIRLKVEKYLIRHPSASFKEVEAKCFPNQEGNIKLLTISPRHFEAAMTKTCQILLEGNYSGILKPNIHYIPLKHDYSNLEEVVDKSLDETLRNSIIDNAYNDLILSGKYSYKKFVGKVVKHLKVNQFSKKGKKKRVSETFFNLKLLRDHLLLTQAQLFYLTNKIVDKSKYRFIILPGSMAKQTLVRRKLWPFKVSSDYK